MGAGVNQLLRIMAQAVLGWFAERAKKKLDAKAEAKKAEKK